MIVSSPIARAKQPRWHSSSRLQSIRENDSTSRQWLRQGKNGQNSETSNRADFFKNQILNKLRRRIVGGGGAATTGMVFKGEFDPSASYDVQNVVVFTSDGGSAGLYIALQQVSGISPDIGAPKWLAFPNSPPGVFGTP